MRHHAAVSAGKCKEFLQTSVCKDVEAGEGAVAECISDMISAAESGENEEAGRSKLTD